MDQEELEEKKAVVYKPSSILDEDKFREHLKTPESEIKSGLGSVLLFLVFGVTFTIVVFLLFQNPEQATINRAVKTELAGYDYSYTAIVDQISYFNWISEFIVYFLQESYYYNGPERILPEVSYVNNLISNVRITHRRMRLVKETSIFKEKVFSVWAGKGFSPTGPKNSDEDTENFCIQDVICEECDPLIDNICEYNSSARMPGYIAWLDVLVEGDPGEIYSNLYNKLRSFNSWWINRQTRSLIVDFVLYNPYVKIYSYGLITLEFSEAGSVSSKFKLKHFQKSYYGTSGVKLFRTICEILFALSLVLCIFHQPLLIYQTYKKVRSDLEDQAITKTKQLKSKGVDEVIDPFSGVLNKIKLFLLVIYEHFSVLWNILDLLCIVLAFVAVVYWLLFLVHQNSYEMNDTTKGHHNINDEVLHACDLLYTCRTICAFNLVFIFIRLLKCVMHLMPRLSLLFDTLSKASNHIFFFFIIAIAFLFAFVLFMYLFFGPFVKTYARLTEVIEVLFRFMNGWSSSLDEITDHNSVIGTLIFIIFSALMTFLLLNMFVGFLHRSYKEANEERKNRIQGRDKYGRKVEYFIEVHFINRIRNFAYASLGVVNKKYKERLKAIQNDHYRYTNILKMTKNESEYFDREFNPMVTFSQEKVKLPLTSHYTESLEGITRDKRCGRIFYTGIVFFIFLVIAILQLVFQLRTDIENDAVYTHKLRYTKDIVIEDEESDTCNYTADVSRFAIDDVTDMEYISRWIRCGPYYYDDLHRDYYLAFDSIVKDSYRITLRQGKQISDVANPFEPYYVKISSLSDLSKADPLDEDRPEVSVHGCEYKDSGGYGEKGGLICIWESGLALEGYAQDLVNSKIIKPNLWVFAFEHVSYAVNAKLFLYHSVVFTILDTGKVVAEVRNDPLFIADLKTSKGVLILVFEILFIIFLIYYIVTYVLELITKWREYSKWLNAEMPYLSNLELFQRNEKSPEVLRQLLYVFSIFRLLDLMFFVLSIVATVNWILYMSRTHKFVKDLTEEFSSDYINEIKDAYETLRVYVNCSSISLIILAIKSIEYLQHSGQMGVLTATLSKAMEDLFYLLVITIILLVGFSGIANIAFSQILPSFRTFAQSWMTCIVMLMGEFDTSQIMHESESITMFFLFFYLILFMYILINFIIAILEINIAIAKADISKFEEKTRKINVLLCCWVKVPERGDGKEKMMSEIVTLPAAVAHLDELGILLNARNQPVRWWADGLAVQIYSEKRQRKLFKSQMLNKVFKVQAADQKHLHKEVMLESMKERVDYLHYLRVTGQLMEFQRVAAETKVELYSGKVKRMYDEFLEQQAEYFKSEKVLKRLEEETNNRIKCINNKLAEMENLNKANEEESPENKSTLRKKRMSTNKMLKEDEKE